MNIDVILDEADEAGFRSHWARWPALLTRMDYLKRNGLTLTRDQLLIYSMYYEWHDEPGWQRYADLCLRLASRRERFEDYLADGDDLRLSRRPVKDIIEAFGIGASLAASAEILGLTEADFRKIPETSLHTTLDFSRRWTASDGDALFNVEAKGTVDGASRAKHVKSIREKKADPRRAKGDTPLLELGMVLDLPRRGPLARLFLIDPPGERVASDPIKWKLLSRQRYYQEELRRISAGRLSTSLADRIEVLDRLERYVELDGLPITGPFGEPVIVGDSMGYTLKTTTGPVHGRVYDLAIPPRYDFGARPRQGAPQSERLLFRGLKREVVVSLGTQKFEAIVSYKCRPGAVEVHHWMNGGRSGSLQLSSAGVVTGFISDPDWDRRSGLEDEAR